MKEDPFAAAGTSESSPGTRWILRSAFAAFQPNRLTLGTFLALLLAAAGSLADRLHGALSGHESSVVISGTTSRGGASGPCAAFADSEAIAWRGVVDAVLSLEPRPALDALGQALVGIPTETFRVAPWTMSLVAIVWLMLAGLFGGALARATALEAGRSVRIGARDALAAVRGRWVSLSLAPLLPIVGAAILLAPVAVISIGFRWPALDLLAGVLYGPSLFLGFLAAFLLIVGGLCLPLMPASIACGDADAADAFTRNAAYLVRAPFLWFGSAATVLVALALGFAVAASFAAATSGLTGLVADWAGGGLPRVAVDAWAGPAEERRASAWLVSLWQGLLQAILAGWVVSFAFEAATRVYLTLRFRCDGQDPSTLDGVPLSSVRPGSP